MIRQLFWQDNRRYYIIAGALLLLFLLWWIFRPDSWDGDNILVAVKKGKFEIIITTTGELQAKDAEEIEAPSGFRRVGIWRVKISDLVPEGTVVEAGDYVAELDRSEISTKLQESEGKLQEIRSQYTQVRLDTAIELKEARNKLIDLRYQMEERELDIQEAQYEPPATQRRLQNEYDKAKRAYHQAVENFAIKKEKARAQMMEVGAKLAQEEQKYQFIRDVLEEFTITAPKAGMVVYRRTRGGEKVKIGSDVTAWSPTVATLPDMSRMFSKTYVNEVDISRIREGQSVEVRVDAFPDKRFTGEVTDVANVGEALSEFNAKVFEVIIALHETDTVLRPGMTTSNAIITSELTDVHYVPLECLHNNDTVSFVYKSSGMKPVRQEVTIGETNENHAVIETGLEEGDRVYLTIPEGAEDTRLIRLAQLP